MKTKPQTSSIFERLEKLDEQIVQLQTIVDHLDERLRVFEKRAKQDDAILSLMFTKGK